MLQTDGQSGPSTRPAFAKAKQVKNRRFFEHPQHIFELLGKKQPFYAQNLCPAGPMKWHKVASVPKSSTH